MTSASAGSQIDAPVAEKIAAGANFVQANQDVAFRVATAYYKLLTAQERLLASRETLKTAQTTQDAAEAQLTNGRSTVPDVYNAKTESAQTAFDMESADGDEKIARVTLAEEVGAEPSPDIQIEYGGGQPCQISPVLAAAISGVSQSLPLLV